MKEFELDTEDRKFNYSLLFDPLGHAYSEIGELETRENLINLFKYGINVAGISHFQNGLKDENYRELIIDLFKKKGWNVNIHVYWAHFITQFLKVTKDSSISKLLKYKANEIWGFLDERFPLRYFYDEEEKIFYDLMIPYTLDEYDAHFEDLLYYRLSRLNGDDIDRFLKFNKISESGFGANEKTARILDFPRNAIDQQGQKELFLFLHEKNISAYRTPDQQIFYNYFSSTDSDNTRDINELVYYFCNISSTIETEPNPFPIFDDAPYRISIHEAIRDQLFRVLRSQFDIEEHIELKKALYGQKIYNNLGLLFWKNKAKVLTEIFGYLYEKGMINNTKEQIADFIKGSFAFKYGGERKGFTDSTLKRNLQKTHFDPFPFEEIEFLVKEIKSR